MDIKKILAFPLSLILILSSLIATDFIPRKGDVTEPTPTTVSTPPIVTPTVTPTVESVPAVESTPEVKYTFYDVPFDKSTQIELQLICEEYGLRYELILGVISVESFFDPTTIGDNGHSYGLMQIQPRWWGELMKNEDVTDLLDPLQNVRCGCAILKRLHHTYGTEYRALQAYNTGNPDSTNGYADRVYRYADSLVEVSL